VTIRQFGSYLLLPAACLGAGCSKVVLAEATPTEWDAGGAGSGSGDTPSGGGAEACPEGTTFCDTGCVSLRTSPTHCGACGMACASAMTCVAGQCVCQGSLTLCDGVCLNVATDGNNCGSCGNVCQGLVCSAGACTNTCASGTPCGTSCTDLDSDFFNCGACGNVCPAGQECQGGGCSCPVGQLWCDSACIDVFTDPAHCGACGAPCAADATCVDGTCQVLGVGGTGAVGGGGGIGGTPVGSGGAPLGGTTTGGRPTGGATTGGRPTGGAATGGASTGEYTVDDGGYVTTCSWHGYAWTGAGPDATSTIQPAGFGSVTAGTRLCASGTVGADPDYAGYAMIGSNINQNDTGDAESPNPAIAPQGNGLYVSVTNSAANSLRIQIQDDLGGDDANHRWCALYSGPGVIPWGNFNTACWDDSGSSYAREPINAVIVAVPGDNTNDTPFDFCVNEIRPAGDPSCPN
jgi:hypothetical protein